MNEPKQPPVWRRPTGAPVAWQEKLKVFNENYRELQQLAQDAIEDALLMERYEAQTRRALHGLVDSLQNPCSGRG
jgi:hypothetical protein